jgi:hypothetical protein
VGDDDSLPANKLPLAAQKLHRAIGQTERLKLQIPGLTAPATTPQITGALQPSPLTPPAAVAGMPNALAPYA